MTTMKTYYRVDFYIDNFGQLLYIIDSKPTHFTGECTLEKALTIYGGEYWQVTKFEAPADIADYKEAWEQGEIISTKYFKPW
jgi:hypothetical protein